MKPTSTMHSNITPTLDPVHALQHIIKRNQADIPRNLAPRWDLVETALTAGYLGRLHGGPRRETVGALFGTGREILVEVTLDLRESFVGEFDGVDALVRQPGMKQAAGGFQLPLRNAIRTAARL